MEEQLEEADHPPLPLPDLKVVEEMQLGIVDGFAEVQLAKAQGKPVVFSSVLLPKEIFQAMDVPVVYGNVLGAYASIFGLSGKYCGIAEDLGTPRDVCAVHRCTIGVACADERDDFFNMAFAVPDLALANNFPCASEAKSFLAVVDKYGIPHHVVDTPIRSWDGELPDHAVRYLAGQYRGMVAFLERHGYRMDLERLREEIAFTKALNTLMAEIEICKQAVPAPMSAYDSVIAATAPLVLGKEKRTLAIFERLRDELRDRVRRGKGVVENERLRLLWIGVPPLCDFKLVNYSEHRGAVVAKNLVELLAGFMLDPALIDPQYPFESLARAQLENPLNPPGRGLIDYFVRATREYRIDGVLGAVKRTCAMLPSVQRLTKDAIQRATGVPTIIFDLDGVDAREYDAASTHATIDAFLDVLLARKEKAS
ncbi:MAG: 2-hydroxyacyl-CoA dehydratase [Deltaproteobacteria bacterium]|nr:2-hydroxyacyl-CoA dehydratase [Deltaproteobacteria bacterium]